MPKDYRLPSSASNIHTVAIPFFLLMSVYYVSPGLLTIQFGPVAFWVGFALFCFAVAVLIVWTVDVVRSLPSKRDESGLA